MSVVCPRCGFTSAVETGECARCGVVFEKYLRRLAESDQADNDQEQTASGATDGSEERDRFVSGPAADSAGLAAASTPDTPWDFVKNMVLFVKAPVHPVHIGLRGLLCLVLAIWGVVFIFSPLEPKVMNSFWHLVNLPFHEAGHVILSPFGKFITMIGGSLLQLTMPLICLFSLLLWTRDTFGAAACLWWFGESFIDLAPYIGDARALRLTLLGGYTGREVADYHDWEYILRKLGWLEHDISLAWTAHIVGTMMILLSLVWAGYVLWLQYKNMDR